MEQQIYSVTQINTYIQSMMDSDRLLSGLCIRGEISNYKVYPSGHHYFSLKRHTGALFALRDVQVQRHPPRFRRKTA